MKDIKFELESRILFKETLLEKNDIFTHCLFRKKLLEKDKEIIDLMKKFEIIFSIIEKNLYNGAYKQAFLKLIFLKKIKKEIIIKLSQ